ncbi:TraB/GumN family protein [Albimonas sp. CAU 1670]|uniref:TraB/GumN family protein n=1 Tax=Albimonas sp. CAU 1670 TaxID=3032599 RepID=UPI0023DC752C|nr:TraB/GumN family protein [Albimonas sp. CAU 1670]MDF2235524.1 TraB/GumN family protein [Albimonas sp. CAU 1670]
MLSRFAKRIFAALSSGDVDDPFRTARDVASGGLRRKARAAGRLAAGASALLWAGAAAADCGGGRDLLAALAQEDPAAHAEIMAAAAAEPDPDGVFWRVTRPGAAESWLMGSFHIPHPLIDPAPPKAMAALDRARVMLMEMSPEELARFGPMAAADPTLVANVDHPPLDQAMSAEDFAAVAEAMQALGAPPERTAFMRPWIVSLTLATPPCAMAALAAGAEPMDTRIAARAAARGLEVKGMETWEDLLPMLQADEWSEQALRSLANAARDAAEGRDMQTTSARLYAQERVWPLWTWSEWRARQDGLEEAMAEARVELFEKRNLRFVEAAAPELERGGAFVLVGALHLGGEGGMIELLRARGFTVERAALR